MDEKHVCMLSHGHMLDSLPVLLSTNCMCLSSLGGDCDGSDSDLTWFITWFITWWVSHDHQISSHDHHMITRKLTCIIIKESYVSIFMGGDCDGEGGVTYNPVDLRQHWIN